MKSDKNKPWSTHKQWIKNPNLVPPPELIADTIAEKIPPEQKRDRCLFALIYLTAGRISELVNFVEYKSKVKYPGIIPKDINIVEYRNKDGTVTDVLRINLRNLKNRNLGSKTLPISLNIASNKAIWELARPYYEQCRGSQFLIDEPMFPISSERVRQLGKTYFGFGCHVWRHFRLTNLYVLNNLNEVQMVKAAGWSNTNPLLRYVHMKVEDLINKL